MTESKSKEQNSQHESKERDSANNERSSSTMKLLFANDGSFMEQFLAAKKKENRQDKGAEKTTIKVDGKQIVATRTMLTSFSTKPKKEKDPSLEPEPEDRMRKRRRDEYLIEMQKYRSSSCGCEERKRPLVR
mmetsp:Transcript_40805/g.128542  ORF Transcript_40805/g.128542 Transcript_40805/m.128542 type:complete len:132 (-) Transcript_40805:1495-1890(-)